VKKPVSQFSFQVHNLRRYAEAGLRSLPGLYLVSVERPRTAATQASTTAATAAAAAATAAAAAATAARPVDPSPLAAGLCTLESH
jgi:hypothetical protein